MELKKILLFGLSMAVISSSAMAFDCNKIEPEARIGVAIDNVINTGVLGYNEEIGTELGLAAFYPVKDKIKVGVSVGTDIYQHYNMYSIGLLGKYQYNKKIDFVGGVSYNTYAVDGNNPDGIGLEAQVDYNVYKNIDLYGKYKYINIHESGVNYVHNTTFGVKYKF